MERLIKFIDRIWAEYPVPRIASIWSTMEDPELFIEFCLDDLGSDLEVYESVIATGLITRLPDTARAVASVKLTTAFQGNKFVKFSYDNQSKLVELRYFPATITYKRKVTLEDLSDRLASDGITVIKGITGSRLQFIKAYVLERMLSKEISYLTAVNLNSDAGALNVDYIESARRRNEELYIAYKDDIMLYSNG